MISVLPPSERSFYLINLSLGCHGDDLPENEEAPVRGPSRARSRGPPAPENLVFMLASCWVPNWHSSWHEATRTVLGDSVEFTFKFYFPDMEQV